MNSLVRQKTFINHHWGELDGQVLEILQKYPDLWDEIELSDLLHTVFYDVLDQDGKLIAFFGNAYWNNEGCNECILCCVYVMPEYRRKGIFKKIVKYTIDHNSDATIISIGAKSNNRLAFHIYSHLFTYSCHDEETDGDWFLIKDRRGAIKC